MKSRPELRSRLTAQLVLSDCEAYVVYSDERPKPGPNGEPRIARLLYTADAGEKWRALPWRRSLWSRILHAGFPVWPPEAVLGIKRHKKGVKIIHRDEWIPYESGGESLWESFCDGRLWHVHRLRYMDYDKRDYPLSPAEVALDLPSTIKPPWAKVRFVGVGLR